MSKKKEGIGFFERYLTLWVALCIIAGIAVGQWFPALPNVLGRWEYANVSIPIALLIWLMIYPMMENLKSIDPLLYSKLTHQKNIRFK